MKNRVWLFRTLLVSLLLFAQHGALAHALKHSAEPEKVTAHAELCSQCLDFAQVNAAPLAIDLPTIAAPADTGAALVIALTPSIVSDSPSFHFQSRAPPTSFT